MKKKVAKICQLEDCRRTTSCGKNFCNFHCDKITVGRFLSKLYTYMKKRVDGKATHNRGNWAGKPILPKRTFEMWGRNHPTFLSLYKQWVMSDFDNRLTPSINRINSNKGYTLDNMEWMTNSQNSGLSIAVRKLNQRKEIYNLLGVSNVKTK